MPPRRVFTSAPKLDEEARRRSEAATQQLMQNYNGQPNVGIKLMSKMGYGVAGELCTVWRVTVYHTVTSHQLPDGSVAPVSAIGCVVHKEHTSMC